MVSPLQSIDIKNHPLGNELYLEWVMPVALPDNYRLAIFKNTAAITDGQIAAYFAGTPINMPVTFILPDGNGNIVDGIIDMNVENGKHYYYRLLIQDTDSDDLSTTVDTDLEVTSTYESDIIDCKSLVIEAIKRILKNYKLDDWRHYEIRRQWTPPSEKNPTIYVVRAPGQVVQRYMGDTIRDNGYGIIQGVIEQDNIEVVWEDPNFKRIDTLTNIFRGSKTIIKRYLLANGVTEIEIVMGGDAVNASFKDRMQPTASMMVQCTFEVQEAYNDKTVHAIAGQELEASN